MSETEITVQCFDNKDKVHRQLTQQGWTVKEFYSLNDWYFSAKEIKELKSLDYTSLISNSFLVRQIKEASKETFQLCYKAKEVDRQGNVLSETKTNAIVNSLEKTLEIFKLAGLTMWCSTKNSTCVYQKGELELCFQDIEDLGVFIEVEEYPSIKHLSPKDKQAHLIQLVKSTNLSLGDDFSCKKVFLKFKKENK